jgi:hypothetical protein
MMGAIASNFRARPPVIRLQRIQLEKGAPSFINIFRFIVNSVL